MITFIRIIELAFVAISVLVLVSQIAVPLIRNRPMFPFFRTKGIEKDLAEANEALDIADLHREVEAKRKEWKSSWRRPNVNRR